MEFCLGGSPKARENESGDLTLAGHVRSEAPTGLVFDSAATDAAGLASDGDLQCSSLSSNQATWLDNESNLEGGLVVRRADGKAALYIGSSGTVKVRGDCLEGFGVF